MLMKYMWGKQKKKLMYQILLAKGNKAAAKREQKETYWADSWIYHEYNHR